jgi:hypothetical protein
VSTASPVPTPAGARVFLDTLSPIRVLGIPIAPPQTVVNRLVSDVAAIARLARTAPRQLDRLLELGEELTELGHRVVDITERLDRRAEKIMQLGEQLDGRAQALVELGGTMQDLGERVDARGAEIVDRAARVVETGSELITVLPTLERALEMATPLEGAIDRFGRFVDRLPGAGRVRPDRPTGPSGAPPAASGRPPPAASGGPPPASSPGTTVRES